MENRIEQISKIKNHRIFHNFTWGKDLESFSKYNLIFGRNGSGKSTLSNIFRAIQKLTSINEGDVEFVISGKKNSSLELASSPTAPSVRVFNKDFISENIFTSHGSVSPVFFLGEENIEKQKEIENLKLVLIKNSIIEKEKRDEKSRSEKSFEDFKSARAKIIKNSLSSSGTNPYNSYDKRAFQASCNKLNLQNEPNLSQFILNDNDVQTLNKEKNAVLKNKLNEIYLPYPNAKGLFAEVNTLLQHSVVSNSIESLTKDPWLSEWVRAGHSKHKEKQSADCLFCGQHLPAGSLETLENHFNNEYNAFISKTNALSAAIQAEIDRIRRFTMPNKLELYDHLISEYEIKTDAFTGDMHELIAFLDHLKLALLEKSKNPFQQIPELAFRTCGKPDLLFDLNAVIRKHNAKTDGFQNSINEARAKLEQSLIAESYPEFKSKADFLAELDSSIENVSAENARIKKRIYELEKDLGSHCKPAEELNSDLLTYFGREDLIFETKENGYQINRNGVLAHHLSEGEKTAIALIYFLKSLGDKSFALKDGIVVIDDPVANLDSSGLLRAFELIKSRTHLAGQLFILTHSQLFSQQVKEWLYEQNISGQKPQANFYILRDRIEADKGIRTSSLSKLDPFKNEHEEEYHIEGAYA